MSWCLSAHTLRKTGGYQQRVQHDTPVALLMRAYGHASEAIAALFEKEDCDVLSTGRQRSGLMSIDHEIRERGNEVSTRLGIIRKQVRDFLG